MDGPNIGAYLVVASLLFGVGALGVMLRRSPLIVLLSLELMLNAANLTLIAFARQNGELDGQIFALAVMAVAAAEVAIGLGLIVAMARRRHRARRRPGERAAPDDAQPPPAPGCACSRRSPGRSRSRSPVARSRGAPPAGSRRSRPSSRSAAPSLPSSDLWAADPADREQVSTAYTWLVAGDLEVEMQILLDTLSSTMMLIVSGVGGLIVWYSMGYMEGDDEERRYFAYMSLFVFSMLMLVQAGNLLLLLVGWGLVGLASYLLIGFWHQRPEAVAAAKKAFVMNAIGDATLALGLVLLIWETGTLEYLGVFEEVDSLSTTTVNLVALGLLGGAVAKSAQIPLHTWLPDAMEGPTPVSALIHAATMVTAGVYLLVRASPIFEAAPDVQALAAILGAITLLVAGAIALAQWDIKRVIAYSTMSQIGYMFVAAGIGAYGYAIFHLMTHAFFKALLFMSAGLVIHHLGGEQDIRKMGGLRSLMPRTHIAFLVGSLSLAGIPIFAGFWSKDGIISAAFASDDALGAVLYAAMLVGALLTGSTPSGSTSRSSTASRARSCGSTRTKGTVKGRARCSSRSACSPSSRRSGASS